MGSEAGRELAFAQETVLGVSQGLSGQGWDGGWRPGPRVPTLPFALHACWGRVRGLHAFGSQAMKLGPGAQPSTLWEAVVTAPPSPQSPNWWVTSARSEEREPAVAQALLLMGSRSGSRPTPAVPGGGVSPHARWECCGLGRGAVTCLGPPAASGRAEVDAGGQLTPATARAVAALSGGLGPQCESRIQVPLG